MLFQQKIINNVKIKCNEDSFIVSAMMYGSFTKGEGDRFSDVEFYIFIEDDFFEEFHSNKWISSLYPTDLIYFNEHGTQVVIFENLLRGEFHFLPQSKMEVIKSFKPTGVFPDANAMFIYDATGQLKALLDYLGGEGPDRKTNENVNFAFNNFINYWLMGVNVLKRGEHARSLEVLSHVQKHVIQLMRINENTVERWLNSTKNLENDLQEESYKEFVSITADLNREKIWKAYEKSVELMERVYLTLDSKYSIEVDKKLFAKMLSHIKD
ncbi:hypothetical protein [Bacillus sp. JCM 19041]|uniref:hypothetical protein n=1 Tax=Bacillus sp. JCM 19041 TaxID=1460637 RepID=UPI0006D25527